MPTITLLYSLPRTNQKLSQQLAETQNVVLEQGGELEALRIQETARSATPNGSEIDFSVTYQSLGPSGFMPGFTDLFPTLQEQEDAFENIWTARLQASLKNRCRQLSIQIV